MEEEFIEEETEDEEEDEEIGEETEKRKTNLKEKGAVSFFFLLLMFFAASTIPILADITPNGTIHFWNLSGNSLFPNNLDWDVEMRNTTVTNITITSLISCDTLDTDATGKIICGSDATGAGGATTNIFDQDLNKTSNVTFFNITANDVVINDLIVKNVLTNSRIYNYTFATLNNINLTYVMENSTYYFFLYNMTDTTLFYNMTESTLFYNMTDTTLFYNMTETPLFYNHTLAIIETGYTYTGINTFTAGSENFNVFDNVRMTGETELNTTTMMGGGSFTIEGSVTTGIGSDFNPAGSGVVNLGSYDNTWGDGWFKNLNLSKYNGYAHFNDVLINNNLNIIGKTDINKQTNITDNLFTDGNITIDKYGNFLTVPQDTSNNDFFFGKDGVALTVTTIAGAKVTVFGVSTATTTGLAFNFSNSRAQFQRNGNSVFDIDLSGGGSGRIHFEPRDTAPSSPLNGDMYYDSTGNDAFCGYINGAWVVLGGTGSCA